MVQMYSQSRTKLKNNGFRKRSDLDIMSAILREAKQGKVKTRIMFQCNLSYNQLRNYIQLLLEIGLLDMQLSKKNKKQIFRSTSKGLEFLKKYTELKKIENLDSNKD